ncbi:TolC family protein [Mangrovimonas sp. AS39]|uniref:TolC family protein n=1 Tax=Mangrovimonas futianensis TaxID=2895523 RepID=UPI001E3F3BE7|nr:TolC family protein [Mangrovimonas futianensis]MCF1190036.1 TolC family protein [Mangrovimonas futianensis]MCF1194213.1 TolC family protein [Mangrovimonas futianensis]
MKQTLILIFSLLLGLPILSQEIQEQSFSLQEAIDYALEHNRSALNAQKDIEAAEQQKWETTATGLPQLDAKIDYQNFIKQQVQLVPAEFFGGNQGEFLPVTFGTKQSVNASATLNQLLFDGSYLVGLQSAKVYLEISENAKEKTDLEVRRAVINAYGNVLLSKESVEILNRNIQVVEENLNETDKIFQEGLEEQESVEQLQITLSGLKSNLNRSERLERLAYQMLNITLGLDINSPVTLTDDLEALALQNMSLDLLNVEENVSNNIDFQIAENDKISKELLLKLEKSKFLPTLSAFVNGAYMGNSNEFSFLQNDQLWYGSSLLGVSLNIPIFSSGMRSAATQRAKINLDKAETDLTETEQQIKLEIAKAKTEYQYAIEDYEIKKENLELAERIEQKNQTKFFEGIGSSFDLRQAQTQLYQAQQDFLQAMLNVINFKVDLETALNTINN